MVILIALRDFGGKRFISNVFIIIIYLWLLSFFMTHSWTNENIILNYRYIDRNEGGDTKWSTWYYFSHLEKKGREDEDILYIKLYIYIYTYIHTSIYTYKVLDARAPSNKEFRWIRINRNLKLIATPIFLSTQLWLILSCDWFYLVATLHNKMRRTDMLVVLKTRLCIYCVLEM